MGETGQGSKGCGSTRMNAGQSGMSQESKIKSSRAEQRSVEDSRNAVKAMNEEVRNVKRSQMQQTRQIISARYLQKLAKNDNLISLAIIR